MSQNKIVASISISRNIWDLFGLKSRNKSADLERILSAWLNIDEEANFNNEEYKKLFDELSLIEAELVNFINKVDELTKKKDEISIKLSTLKIAQINQATKQAIENDKYIDAIANTMQHVRAMGWHNPYDPDNYVKTDKEGNPIRKKNFEVENEESSWKK